jgi:undecaprenyl-diphosphatase
MDVMATRAHSQLAQPGTLRDRFARALDRIRHLAARARRVVGDLLARHPKNARSVARLLLGAAPVLVAGFAFLELGEEVREGELVRYDDAILLWLAEHRAPALTQFFLAITALGSWPVITLLTIGVCVGALLARERRLATTVALAMTGVPLLSHFLKTLYARERPSVVPHLETVASASFPSGHTLASVVFFVTLALLAAGHLRRRRLRVFVVGYSLAIGALVAASRIYLGVHFPSDVTGGALVGIAWSLAAVTLDRALRGKVK